MLSLVLGVIQLVIGIVILYTVLEISKKAVANTGLVEMQRPSLLEVRRNSFLNVSSNPDTDFESRLAAKEETKKVKKTTKEKEKGKDKDKDAEKDEDEDTEEKKETKKTKTSKKIKTSTKGKGKDKDAKKDKSADDVSKSTLDALSVNPPLGTSEVVSQTKKTTNEVTDSMLVSHDEDNFNE